MNNISSIKIVKVNDIKFSCPICDQDSQPKYHVTINDEQTREMCLNCHNKIASTLLLNSKLSKSSKRKTTSVFKKMYGDNDENKDIWNKYCT